jgi:hypothetical protein
MSRVPATKVADPQQTIAELQRQLAARTAELDEAQQQLIERTAERDEGEAQKAAIAEVLGAINSSAGDLPPVFDAILEKAMRLCETNGGYFLRYQDGNHLLAAGRGLQPALAAFLSQQDQPSAGSPAALVAQGAPYIHITDLKDNDHYRSGAPDRACLLGGFYLGHLDAHDALIQNAGN